MKHLPPDTNSRTPNESLTPDQVQRYTEELLQALKGVSHESSRHDAKAAIDAGPDVDASHPFKIVLEAVESIRNDLDAFFEQQERSEKTLRQNEERYRTILENIEEGYYETDLAGNLTFFNDSLCRILGYPRDELMGMNNRQYMDQENARKAYELINRVFTSGKPDRGIDWEFIRKNGTKRHVESSISLLKDSEGRATGFRGILRDITERKHAEEATKESEEKYRHLVENADDIIYSTDASGHFTFFNRIATETTGYSIEELIGKRFLDLVRPDYYDSSARFFNHQFIKKTPSTNYEFPMITKQGKELWLEAKVQLIFDGDEVVGFHALARDCTKRREAEEALRESEEKYRTILENIEEGYYEVDLAGNFTFFNDSTVKIIGYPREELIGINNREYMNEDNARQVYKVFNRVFTTGQPDKGIDWEIIRKDGSRTYVATSVSLMADDQGRPMGFRGILADITRRKQAEEELLQAKDRAEETNRQLLESTRHAEQLAQEAEGANRAKGDFLANMSHEIRTPMNAIIGMTGLLLDTGLASEQREYAKIVRNSGEALLGVINDILDFSKIEAGKLELEIIDFDLRTCLEDVGDMLAQKAHDKGLELAIVINSDVPLRVKGDAGRLRQVIINLANNAIKFTKKGEVVIRANLAKLTDNRQTVKFDVIDTGIGIPEERQKGLFLAFSQGDASTTRKYGGTGLGLAISKQLVGIMGGQIQVESQKGKGSAFSFTAVFERQTDCGNTTDLVPAAAVKGLRVLIVDDNKTNRLAFNEQLKTWDCQTAEAASSPEALEMLVHASQTEEPFQLVLIDIQTPGMKNEEFARTIKSDTRVGHIPLILVTSVPRRGGAVKMLEAGFDAYLTKPVKYSRLYDSIAASVGVEGQTGAHRQQVHITRPTFDEAARGKFRILVAEDNIVNQKVAARMLEKGGYRCDVAANGQEAVEALSRIPYDIVFMDCQMPEMSGYEATQEIRKLEGKRRHTPIIAMTAYAMKGDREQCLAVGMDDYISKPVTPAILNSIMEKHLRAESIPATTTQETATTHPVDIQRLLEIADGDIDFERDLIDDYLTDNKQRLSRLETALKEQEAELFQGEAHAIKGSSLNIGAKGMQDLAHQLEQMGTREDLSEALEVLDTLKSEFEQVRNFFRDYFRSRPS